MKYYQMQKYRKILQIFRINNNNNNRRKQPREALKLPSVRFNYELRIANYGKKTPKSPKGTLRKKLGI